MPIPSAASAIWYAVRLVVPSSSMEAVSWARPRLPWVLHPAPPPSTNVDAITGNSRRGTTQSGMPQRSVIVSGTGGRNCAGGSLGGGVARSSGGVTVFGRAAEHLEAYRG